MADGPGEVEAADPDEDVAVGPVEVEAADPEDVAIGPEEDVVVVASCFSSSATDVSSHDVSMAMVKSVRRWAVKAREAGKVNGK